MDNTYYIIKEKAIKWVKENCKKFKEKKICIVDEIDSMNGYSVFFDCENCMAQLVVENPIWAPYRYVTFEVVAMVNEKPQGVYFWYDSKDTKVMEILEQLDKGIEFACCYKETL